MMENITKLASSCRTATPHNTVSNNECVYTFHTPYTTPTGILVNLNTFVGSCQDVLLMNGGGGSHGADGAPVVMVGKVDNLYLRIVKKRVEKKTKQEEGGEDDEGGEKKKNDEGKEVGGGVGGGGVVTKLGIGVEGGFRSDADKYDTQSIYSIVTLEEEQQQQESEDDNSSSTLLKIGIELPYDETTKDTFPMNISLSADSIIHHAGMAVQQDLKAWELDEEPKPISKYCDTLPFVDNGIKINPDPSTWKCEKSGDTTNLWLNLSDGFIGGGRRNWDGSGGSNGALDHYVETGKLYPLVVKLGTITNDVDTADCYSYDKDEDGPVKIPNLAVLLDRRGIKVAGLQKTVKSTAELEVELNATYAFDAITESGSTLVPVSGPQLQGLQNLGNSCYINTVVQCLLGGSIPELMTRYGSCNSTGSVAAAAVGGSRMLLWKGVEPTDAANDVLVQTSKLGWALTSGEFAKPNENDDDTTSNPDDTDPKYRLAPRMFKHATCRNHVDFCTGQQQDSADFLRYFLETLSRAELGGASRGRLVVAGGDADGGEGSALKTTPWLFTYQTTTKWICQEDDMVKYRDGQVDTILSLPIPMDKAEVLPTPMETDDGEDGGTTTTNEGAGKEEEPPDIKRQKSEAERENDINKSGGGDDGDGGDKKEDEKVIPTISLRTCLEHYISPTVVEGMKWSHLSNKICPATSIIHLKTFPRYLLVQLQRYEMGPDWLPKKIEVNVDVPDTLDVGFMKDDGLPKDGEVIVPGDDDGDDGPTGTSQQEEAAAPPAPSAVQAPPIDEGALGQLMDMGFTMNGCKRALREVGGSNVEMAMNWIFEHNTDADFNDPLPDEGAAAANAPTTASSSTGGAAGVDESAVEELVANLGAFTHDQVRAALKVSNGALDRAADWLFSHMDDIDSALASVNAQEAATSSAGGAGGESSSSGTNPASTPPPDDGEGKYTLIGMISHIGKNTGSGHYVCHLKKDVPAGDGDDGNNNQKKWVIFNDEKVALSEHPPKQHAYVYLFQRNDTIDKPDPTF